MMVFKKLPIALLVIYNVTITVHAIDPAITITQNTINQSSRPIGEMATQPSNPNDATKIENFITENPSNDVWFNRSIWALNQLKKRVLSTETGEGYWLITNKYAKEYDEGYHVHHVIYYGPYEWIQPHNHNKHNKFIIRAGSCHLWLQSIDKTTWTYKYYRANAILNIPEQTNYALMADETGLLMDTLTDIKRTTAWTPGLTYETSIQDLRTATNKLLSLAFEAAQ